MDDGRECRSSAVGRKHTSEVDEEFAGSWLLSRRKWTLMFKRSPSFSLFGTVSCDFHQDFVNFFFGLPFFVSQCMRKFRFGTPNSGFRPSSDLQFRISLFFRIEKRKRKRSAFNFISLLSTVLLIN